jgi:hypothetical protein
MKSMISTKIEVNNRDAGAALKTPSGVVARRRRSHDMGTVLIPIKSRKNPDLHAQIDEEDYDLVRQYSWSAFKSGHSWYANTRVGDQTIYMHRLIANPQSIQVVDHINHNGIGNRRDNLRCCSRSVNQQNRRGPQVNIDRPYLGIVLDRRRGTWRGGVRINGKIKGTKGYLDPADAARARDDLAIIHYGPHATLNFPRKDND